ncbi:MAG: acetyl-CoA carboxylase biotin carboxyl carrier protein [Roseiarcus sp.]
MKKPLSKSAAAPASAGFDLSVVAALAEIAGRHDLSEVEVERAGLRVRVARERQAAVEFSQVVAAPAAGAPAPPSQAAVVEPAEHAGAVKSPMVGTAYLRPSPEAKPFVEIGSLVKAGDKVMLVEAMKTFNEIVAPRAGQVTHVLVEDGAPVEYGQALMVIE